MADIFVQLRMKKCCREALARLDAARRPLRADAAVGKVAVLEEELGAQPLPVGAERLRAERAGSAGGRLPSELEARVHRLCIAASDEHALAHHEAGEVGEAAFWQQVSALLADFVAGKLPATGAADASAPALLIPARAGTAGAGGRGRS
ncbi:MAG: hypothetical protein IT373_20420 [Polyangiaceae bacterium]|nr:hypothetical protein [Polyangiaceae bacterium]